VAEAYLAQRHKRVLLDPAAEVSGLWVAHSYDMISALAGIEEEMLQSGLGQLVIDDQAQIGDVDKGGPGEQRRKRGALDPAEQFLGPVLRVAAHRDTPKGVHSGSRRSSPNTRSRAPDASSFRRVPTRLGKWLCLHRRGPAASGPPSMRRRFHLAAEKVYTAQGRLRSG